MRTTRAVFFALILVILVISCTKAEFSATNLQAQPYVRTDGTMGLSLYVIPANCFQSNNLRL